MLTSTKVHNCSLYYKPKKNYINVFKGAGNYSGQGGKSHERGIQGDGGDSRAVEVNRAKKAFCHVLIL